MSEINLWVRADLERDNPETAELLPDRLIEGYTDIMGRLATAKSVVNEALASLYQVEQERAQFFEGFVNGSGTC